MTTGDVNILNDTLKQILAELDRQNRRGGGSGDGNNGGYRPSYYSSNRRDKYYNEEEHSQERNSQDRARYYREKGNRYGRRSQEERKKGNDVEADRLAEKSRMYRRRRDFYTEQTNTARNQSQKNELYNMISNGKSARIFEKGQDLQRVGEAMSAFGGKFGKLGGVVSKAGGVLTKFAGGIGVAVQALQLLRDAAVALANDLSKNAAFTLNEQKLQFERDKEAAKLTVGLAVENANAEADIRKKEIETEASYQVELAKLAQAEYLNAMETQLGSIMNGINKSVWAGYEKSIDIQAQRQSLDVEQGFKRLQAKNYIAERGQENKYARQETEANKYANIVDYQNKSLDNANAKLEDENEHLIASTVTGTRTNGNGVDDASGNSWDNKTFGTDRLVSQKGNIITGQQYGEGEQATKTVMNHGFMGAAANVVGASDAVNAWTKQVAEVTKFDRQSLAESTQTRIALDKQVQTAQLKNENALNETKAQYETEYQKARIDFEKEIKKNWMRLAQHIEGVIETYDREGNDAGISMGIGTKSAMNGYKTYNMGLMTTLGRRFNVKPEDLFKLQSGYAESTGRNKFLNESDYTKNLALGKYIGDNGVAQQLASNMEIFNHGVADSSDMVSEMVAEVNKMGLNGRKYAKELVQSLKLANKYQFKNGVRGLMDMAKWAMNTRFNMNSVGNMLEKIQDGGLENLITTGANMQVLGGSFAMGADPLAMGWEAFNDPKALAERQAGQMRGIGTYNSKTGEVDFNMEDQMRLRAFAKYSGQDYEDLLAQRRQAVRGDKVTRELSKNTEWSKEQKSLVTNKAYKDEKTGRWTVDLLKNGKVEKKDVSQLSEEDLKFLNPTTHNEKMENYMERMLADVEKLEGINTSQNAELALASFNDYLKNYAERGQKAEETFRQNFEEYVQNAITEMKNATDKYGGLMETLINKTEEQSLDNKWQSVIDNTTNISDTITRIEKFLTEGKEAYKNMKDATQEQRVRNSWQYRLFGYKPGDSWSDYGKGLKHMLSLYETQINAAKKKGRNTITISGKTISLEQAQQNLQGYYEARELYKQDKAKFEAAEAEKRKKQNDSPKVKRAKEAAKKGDYCTAVQNSSASSWSSIMDGAVAANDNPMAVAASRVTPIHDGAVAKTDPNDHGIFAKVGGPFDKLFNGVFGKINEVYNTVRNAVNDPVGAMGKVNGKLLQMTPFGMGMKVARKAYGIDNTGHFNSKTGEVDFNMEDQMRLRNYARFTGQNYKDLIRQRSQAIRKSQAIRSYKRNGFGADPLAAGWEAFNRVTPRAIPFGDVPLSSTNGNSSSASATTPLKIEPIKIQMSGSLELTSGGQSINIIKELENNPNLLRTLSNMITDTISKKMNGGRSVNTMNY